MVLSAAHYTFAATQTLLTIVLLGTNVTSVDIVYSRLWTTLASLILLPSGKASIYSTQPQHKAYPSLQSLSTSQSSNHQEILVVPVCVELG